MTVSLLFFVREFKGCLKIVEFPTEKDKYCWYCRIFSCIVFVYARHA
jgi:hypothetical protein